MDPSKTPNSKHYDVWERGELETARFVTLARLLLVHNNKAIKIQYKACSERDKPISGELYLRIFCSNVCLRNQLFSG